MSETLPEIRESEAPPETAAIYAEIREASGLPIINLVWRHLAALPGALPWAWGAVRPLARAGLVQAAAARVCEKLDVAPAAPMDSAALAAVGVHDQSAYGGLEMIRRIVDAYNRGNANNLIALTALLQAMEAGAWTESSPSPEPLPVTERQLAPLPPLPRLADLEERARRSVEALAAGHTGVEAGVIPSLYLHLAHWPGLLEQARGHIEQLPRAQWRDRARALAAEEVRALVPRIAAAPPPEPAREPMEQALRRFAAGLIPEMLPVGLALARALPR